MSIARFTFHLLVIAAMFLTVAAIAKAQRPPQFPARPQPVVEFGPRNLSDAVTNLTILSTCQWQPRRCPAQPDPRPVRRGR